MSDLTKRLPDRLRIHYNLTADDIAEEAADRIDALEECLREILKIEDSSGMAVIGWHDAIAKARALLESQ